MADDEGAKELVVSDLVGKNNLHFIDLGHGEKYQYSKERNLVHVNRFMKPFFWGGRFFNGRETEIIAPY